MKLKKKSTLIGAISVLAGVSVVSVGFASWVVSSADTTSIAGQISVETVEDHRYVIYDKSNISVNYGTDVKGTPVSAIQYGIDDTDDDIDDPWLTASADATYENLTASVVFWVGNLGASDTTHVSASIAPTHSTEEVGTPGQEGYEAPTGWYLAKKNNLVGDMSVALTISPSETADYEVNDITLTYRKVTANITFTWGSKFTYDDEVVNPYVHYNHLTYSDANGEDAVNSLNALHTAMSSVGFTLTISTVI